MYTPERCKTVLEALRLGLSYETAAKLAGVSKVTLYNWREEHEDFATECEQVIAQCEQRLVEVVDRATLDDYKAAQWMLERRFPRTWGTLRADVLAARAAATEAPEHDESEGIANSVLTERVKKGRG